MLANYGSAKAAKCEDLEKVIVDDNPETFFQIEIQLPTQEKEELVEFLRKNVDVFAWNAYETLRVDPSFICHYLNEGHTYSTGNDGSKIGRAHV